MTHRSVFRTRRFAIDASMFLVFFAVIGIGDPSLISNHGLAFADDGGGSPGRAATPGAPVSVDGGAVDVDDGAQRGWSFGDTGTAAATWEIRFNGKLITSYHEDLDGTPGFFPVLTPGGLELTRRFPIGPSRVFEAEDHDHHRSFWFTHGVVNDLDFWIDDDLPHVGRIVQRSIQIEKSGEAVVLTTNNDWVAKDDRLVLSDVRRFRFSQNRGDTLIDTTIELIANHGDVVFGDTKEGSLGVRVAGTMKVDAKKMDKRLGGKIINAEGLVDDRAWSQESAWVDYSGPLLPKRQTEETRFETADELLAREWSEGGITMMYHPANPLPECRWHVRSYGLFAANPFGRRHFGLPAYDGVKVIDGEKLTLDFRVVLHDGAFDAKRTKDHFDDYASTPLSLMK